MFRLRIPTFDITNTAGYVPRSYKNRNVEIFLPLKIIPRSHWKYPVVSSLKMLKYCLIEKDDPDNSPKILNFSKFKSWISFSLFGAYLKFKKKKEKKRKINDGVIQYLWILQIYAMNINSFTLKCRNPALRAKLEKFKT